MDAELMAVRTHVVEALVGLFVVIAAAAMVFLFLERTGSQAGENAVEVVALFPNASGIDIGTEVRVAGLAIGSVTGVSLDPQGYQAEVRMALDRAANLPSDSSAAITAESLLGGSYIAMLPGGSSEPLRDGDVILDTQGAVDMMGLVGSMINGTGGGSSTDGMDTMSDDFVEPMPADTP